MCDKYSKDAQPAIPQTPTQPMRSVPLSKFLYDTLVRGLGISTISGPEVRYAELNEYLHCSSYAQPDESFDILLWWKENRKNIQFYTELQKIFLLVLLLLVSQHSVLGDESLMINELP